MKYIIYFLAAVAVIDMVGFVFWAMSGQIPPDNFYVGSLTRNLLIKVLY